MCLINVGWAYRLFGRCRFTEKVCLFALLFVVGGAARAELEGGPEDGRAEILPERRGLAVGMNLAKVTSGGREWSFVDVFKRSQPWFSQDVGKSKPWKTDQPVELTSGGWPVLKHGQTAVTTMFRGAGGHYPAGRYTLTYQGTGSITMGFDAKRVVRRRHNEFDVTVEPSGSGMYLRIERSDPSDLVRDIRLWMPGFENGENTFHPLFLERLRPFKVIRFMDWMWTNHSKVKSWADRSTPGAVRQSDDKGVSLEYMIELCNTLGADPWFCMPHLADDEYVERFARMVRERLRRDLKVYVEWSNEAWNVHFGQAQWAIEEARRRGVSRERVVAQEAQRDWRIWHKVFEGERSRVVRVAAGHHHGPRFLASVLECLEGEFDAVSCSAYFHLPPKAWKSFDETTSVDDLIEALAVGIRDYDMPKLIKHRDMARMWSTKLGRHIPFIAYEAGQSLHTRRSVAFREAIYAAQADSRMYRLYAEWFNAFHDMGGELLAAYNYVGPQNRFGCWGHLQYQDEPVETAPKYRAVVDAADGKLPVGSRHNGSVKP